MAWSNSLWSMVNYFRKEFVSLFAVPGQSYLGYDTYGRWQARLARYELYWAMYQNDQYDDVHRWSESYRTQYGLYRFTRGVYNPTKRLVDFWAEHLQGGTLDPDAGDGKERPSALPILTANDALRPAIAALWRNSDWQTAKEMYCRLGVNLGDVGLAVVDDPEAGRAAIEVVHPATLKWIDEDRWGNVKAYIREELRLDPEFRDDAANPLVDPNDYRRVVTYTERATLNAARGTVEYETLLNGSPYPWNGVAARWEAPYPFIPLRIHRHMRASPQNSWGMAEHHAGTAKIRNVDDLASKLHDQIRKIVEGMWLMAGVQPPQPGKTPTPTAGAATANNPQAARQETKIVYGGMGATATPLVLPLDIQFTSVEVQNAVKSLEDDYPELAFQRVRLSGDASALALREARKPAEAKVHTRRGGYDHSLCAISKLAIAIGGMRGYPGFEGFGVESLADGTLDHRIGDRPVFHLDPMDRLQEEQLLWQNASVAKAAGLPLSVFLARQGWTEAQLEEVDTARLDEAAFLKDLGLDAAGKVAATDPTRPESDPDDVTPGA